MSRQYFSFLNLNQFLLLFIVMPKQPSPESPASEPFSTIAENITVVTERIRLAEINAARNPSDVKLLAVSKTKSIDMIQQAWRAGQRAFGENYLQEAITKIQELAQLEIEWHFIGAIQSNKTRLIAENFDWVHTIANSKHAQRLNDQRPEGRLALNCCIQVNIDHEIKKAGVKEDEIMQLATLLESLPNLNFRGLMCIPSIKNNTKAQQTSFSKMKNQFDLLKITFPQIDTLSMGMSDDLEQAVACGSTMIRIGTAIFGAREASSKTI